MCFQFLYMYIHWKRFCKYLIYAKLCGVCQKWRFIYMAKQSHVQLKEDENYRRSVCMWQQWGKFEKFLWYVRCNKCMEDKIHKELCQNNVINIQHNSTLRKQWRKVIWKFSQLLLRGINNWHILKLECAIFLKFIIHLI